MTTELPQTDEAARRNASALQREVRPHARTVADHIEQRLRAWRQQQMNRSGDRLALDDFMGEDSITDLVDFVCDEYALDAAIHAALRDCGEAGHAQGKCGNAQCLRGA